MNAHPILIGERVLTAYERVVGKTTTKSVLDNLCSEYIYPNTGILLFITIIGVILFWRYMYNKKNDREKFLNNNPFFDDKVISPYKKMARPLFNPSKPVSEQNSYVNYLPDLNEDKFYPAPEITHSAIQEVGPYYATQ